MKINYNNYKKTIYGLARIYHHKTGIEIDELVSAGNEEFINCQKTFDPSKACFNTYLNWKLKGLFISMPKKRGNFSIIDNISKSIKHDKICSFANLIIELPNDAKEVIKIVFETPAELMDMLPKKQPRGINKTLLIKYLRKHNWTFPKIWKAFDDIKSIWS